jgi:cobalt-zinc-cadmium efflux system outer membrane protein
VGLPALPSMSAVTQESGTPPVSSPVQHSGLTLDQVIRTVLEADPKIRVGWEAVHQAKADLLTSSLPPNPGMLADSIFIPFGKPFTVQKPGGPTQIDIGGNYPIDAFLFGKRAAAIASARLGVDVSAADFADLVRQRVAGAIAAFYDVLEAQALFDLAREDLDNLKRVEAITAQRVALGGVGTIELDRIRLAIFDSQREVRNRDTALAAALAQLRTFLGFTDAAPAFAVQGSLDVPIPAAPLTAGEALALAEQNRPDIISLRRQLAKAEADLHLEKTKAFPDITPGLAWTRQFQPGVPDVSSFSTTVNLSVPLFDRNQGNIAKAQSVRLQATFNLRAQLVSLQAEIAQAVKAYQAAYVTVTTDDPAQLQAATNVRDKIKLAYELGGRPLIEVLDAQRAYRDTYRSYITGRSNYWHTLHGLNAAIGRQVLQ